METLEKQPTTKTAKTKSARVTPTLCETIQLEIAERIVGGYELLDAIDQRTEVLASNAMRLTLAEELQLAEAFPEADTVHKLVTVVGRVRSARLQRQEGAGLAAIEDCEQRLVCAETALDEANADVEALDYSGGSLIAEHIERLQAKLDGLQSAVDTVSDELRTAQADFKSLLSKGPKILVDHCERLINQSAAPRLTREIQQTGDEILRLRSESQLLKNVDTQRRGSSSQMYPEITVFFPECVVDQPNGKERTVDAGLCKRRAYEIDEVDLPDAEERLVMLREELEGTKRRCFAPLHEWARTGRLTVEMILGK